jgi:hypothetical protein
MKKDISLNKFGSAVANVFRRYHLTIFIVILVSGLATAVILLNNILQQSSDTTGLSADATNGITFDQATIKRLNELKTSSDPVVPFSTSGTRISPFSE